MKKKKVRVVITGGAGYIGSHVAKLLVKEGYDVLVIDNLSSGANEVLYGKLCKMNMEDEKVYDILVEFMPDVVMHFAAYIVVPESVKKPFMYYENNVSNTIRFISYMKRAGIRKFIFSSSAAVYGIPNEVPISEDIDIHPINPYGHSKAIIERILKDMADAGEIDYVSLRYFNVAGADPDGELGPSYRQPTHLIIRALKTAKGELPYLEIYGTDYPTSDGTCVRDYIHVVDLAYAHKLAMEYLLDGGDSVVLNCGYGRGFSVKEVISITKKITGVNFKVIETERRLGDPPVLIADSKKIKKILGWKPIYDSLEDIIKDAWNWEIKR